MKVTDIKTNNQGFVTFSARNFKYVGDKGSWEAWGLALSRMLHSRPSLTTILHVLRILVRVAERPAAGKASGLMDEQRGTPRQKSLLRGVVYFDGSPCAVECTVREMSDAGARLKFDTIPLPADSFQLDIPIRGQKLRAFVKWQRDDEMGVSFAQAEEAAALPGVGMVPADTTEELAARVLHLENEIAALHHLVKRLQQKINSKIEAA